MEVVGRHDELRVIAAWLEGAAEDVLLIEGEAGIGKTTIWRVALDEAARRGYTLLSSRAVPTEAQLSLSALRDLLDAGFDEIADDLPDPQRQALAVTLLREVPRGEPPDPGAVGVSVLSALRTLATRGPTLIAFDDVQWLDSASRDPLRYALRRIAPGTVRVLVTRRTNGQTKDFDLVDDDRVRILEVRPLTVGAVGRILHTQLETAYPRPTLHRIHQVSGGNPFFALQLARSLGPSAPAASNAPLPVPTSLHELVDARLLELSPDAFDVLSIAAIASRPTVELLAAALGDDPIPSLEAADAAHIATQEGSSVAFAHPLYAAAVYDLTPAARRAAIHRLLAELAEEPEERARHLAAATTEPDGAIADVARRGSTGRRTPWSTRDGSRASGARIPHHSARERIRARASCGRCRVALVRRG